MGGRGASGGIESKIANRPILDTKTKNQIQKELKEIYPQARVTATTSSVGSGFTESENGKMKTITVDMGTQYISDSETRFERQTRAFEILEKYNRKYKFDYFVDKKKYRSNGKNFKNISKSVWELF